MINLKGENINFGLNGFFPNNLQLRKLSYKIPNKYNRIVHRSVNAKYGRIGKLEEERERKRDLGLD